ncbi:hypothetical protein ACFZDK_50480 [Streptomyces sp. NPDC007901]|uniref:hypothetical protein n=1 Tax=Streptomyces sp. NPDC007901 TaxID=3364785 RepID=UPI0036E69F0A
MPGDKPRTTEREEPDASLRPARTGGAFPAARAAFEQLLADLFDQQGASHPEAEEFIAARGREVHRLMLQE